MRRILTFWLTMLMLTGMMLPTAFAAEDAEASPKEGTEETTVEGEEEGAVKDAEAPKDDKSSAILTTTATLIPTSTAPKTVCYPTAIDVRDEGAEIRKCGETRYLRIRHNRAQSGIRAAYIPLCGDSWRISELFIPVCCMRFSEKLSQIQRDFSGVKCEPDRHV